MVIGISAFLLLGNLTDWQTLKLVVAASVLTFLGDVVMAISMEAVAPTKVDIGPGEKNLVTDMPSESATVISGFDTSPQGQVLVRGEIWRAIRATEDSGILSKGTSARVVDRKGLTLIISAKAS